MLPRPVLVCFGLFVTPWKLSKAHMQPLGSSEELSEASSDVPLHAHRGMAGAGGCSPALGRKGTQGHDLQMSVTRSRVSVAGVVCTLLICSVEWPEDQSCLSHGLHAQLQCMPRGSEGGHHPQKRLSPTIWALTPSLFAPTAKHTAAGCLSSNSLSDHTSCFRGYSEFADTGAALLSHAHSVQHR